MKKTNILPNACDHARNANNTDLQFNNVTLKHINFADKSYCIRPEGDNNPPADFIESIARCGIIHPPIVQDLGEDGYIILAGRRRLQAALDMLKISRCNCLIVPPEKSPIDCLKIILEEGLLSLSWTLITKAKFLQKVVDIIGKKETASEILPRLGITGQMYHLEKILGLADLEEPLAMAIHQGQISEKTAYELCNLSFRDRLILLDLINGLKLSVGNQRQVINFCVELAKRSSSSIHAILTEPAILKIINSGDNLPQQTAKLMKILHDRIFPSLGNAKQEFINWQNSFNLPRWVEVSHSPNFETEQVAMRLNFANRDKMAVFCQKFID